MTRPRHQIFVSLLLLSLLHWATGSMSTAQSDPSAVVTRAELVNLRAGPGTAFDPVGVLSRGETVSVEQAVGEWIHIRTKAGKRGYIHRSYLAASDAEAPIPRATAAPKVATPAAEPPAAAPTAAAPEGELEQLADEIEMLRAEIARMRSGGEAAEAPSPSLGALGGEDLADTQPSFRTIAFGILTFVAGWVVGAALARRRSRSQRSRLRF